jgi:hypothetical protein
MILKCIFNNAINELAVMRVPQHPDSQHTSKSFAAHPFNHLFAAKHMLFGQGKSDLDGVQIGEGDCFADATTGFALTCPGGYTISHTYGRLLVGLYPSEPEAQVVSKDTPGYADYGAVGAYALAIQKRPY